MLGRADGEYAFVTPPVFDRSTQKKKEILMKKLLITAAMLSTFSTGAYAAAPGVVDEAVAACCLAISACCEAAMACCG